MTPTPNPPKRLSRRRFLLGGAGVVTALGAYTVAGWVAEETYQPPRFDPLSPRPTGTRESPSQPIAILIDSSAPVTFGYYLGEILRAEGLNAFQFEMLDAIDADRLSAFSIVVLPPAQLSAMHIGVLTAYLDRGGNLIALQPDAALAPILGVLPAAGSTTEGYLVIHDQSNVPIDPAFVNVPLQVHTEARHYALDGAASLADLYRDRSTPVGFPAVALVERERGRAATFAYDLAYNVAVTRQGNPAFADQDRDGAKGVRTNDLFADWLDLDNLSIPQADAQARLLIDVMQHLVRDRAPLPRLWHFPERARSLLIVTGDSHGVPAAIVEDTLQTVESFGGQATVYYSPPVADGAINGLRRSLARLPLLGWVAPGRGGRPGPETVVAWRARGHEFGVHPYVEDGVDDGYVRYLRAFQRDGYAPASPTVRTHRVLWSGWVETARAQAGRGFRLNVDHYHAGPAFRAADGSWPAGLANGTGLPMKFVDERGQIIDCYQQPTQLADEHWLATTYSGWAKLDGERAARVANDLIDRCIAGAPAALTIQYHMDFAPGDPQYDNARAWLTGILEHARARGVPIWSAQRWLAFVEARHAATFESLRWDDATGTLSFNLNAPTATQDRFSVLVPATFGGRRIAAVYIDDQKVDAAVERVAGNDIAWVTTTAESHSVRVEYVDV